MQSNGEEAEWQDFTAPTALERWAAVLADRLLLTGVFSGRRSETQRECTPICRFDAALEAYPSGRNPTHSRCTSKHRAVPRRALWIAAWICGMRPTVCSSGLAPPSSCCLLQTATQGVCWMKR